MAQLQLLLVFVINAIAIATATVNIDDKPPTLELPRPFAIKWENWEDDEPRNGRSHRPTLMDVALEQSVRQGLDAMADLYGNIQPNILRNGQTLADNHPAAFLARFNAPHGDTERREMAAYATITATKAFRKNFHQLDELARQSHAPKISLRRTALEGLCPAREPPMCMPASERYRTHDGTCNNKKRPRWGAAQMPFNRFLPPEYGDGVDTVRSSSDGSTLSSSRFVSLLVHGARDGEAPLTLMIAQWGQLLDHDMTSTAQQRSINGSIPSCCGAKDFHPSCFPIKVPLDDPWLAPLKVRCLEFLRSAPAQRRDCVLSWREQTNQATSYIDASPIYSNSAKLSDNARVFRNGQLVYGRGNVAEDVCQRGAIASQCIRAGDGRSGEQPGLLALHHVWVGEHNRIAMRLSELNPHWSDEKLYQEARRIIGAMFQHITYREFLPIILGREVSKLFGLELLTTGYYEHYDPKVNPAVANSFAAAAFRFGHSLVQNSYMRCDRHHNIINNNVSLHEEFQRGDIGSAGSLHRLLRGLANQRALKRDEFITPELTNHLFQTPGFPFGLDLAAVNIQRGRDHGIAPYTAWRVPCGLSAIHNWDDFAKVVGPESARRIGHAYRSVHDIDLFVGGIAERPVVGGLVGPTFACIIAQQFSNSRRGDRFWYENGGFESSFTPAQLHSLRRVSLAQVLCRAVGGGTFQPHIFIPAEFSENERLTCGDGVLSPIDLDPWLEQDPFSDLDRTSDVAQNGLSSVQILKEEKAGFGNRIKPTNNGQPHVDFTANSSSGFQRPNNATKIHDKLDIKQKKQPTTTLTPTNKRQTTRKPANGVNNKLDKSPKITVNIKKVNVRRPVGVTGTTTRRTVIINNVPIQLREAEQDDQNIDDPPNDVLEAKTLTETTDIELPTEHSESNKVQSETTSTNDETIETTDTTEEPSRLSRSEKGAKSTPVTIIDFKSLRNRTTPTQQTTHSTRRTTKTPKLSKTTKRGVELRSQYQSRPIYTRPQKVVVNGPNADQYEIEINIRQTNKSPTPIRPVTSANAPQFSNYDAGYAPHYSDYTTTTSPPSYAYYTNVNAPPAVASKTRPPTIIYLNEGDDRYTTARTPNIFQNILTFATNGFNNLRPTPAPAPVKDQRPHYDNILVNSPLSSSLAEYSGGSSLQYAPHPLPSLLPQSGPVSHSGLSYPLTSNQPHSAFAQATSSAVSSGHFGSISGVASANGADSTFSFNIRPRPPPPGNSVVSTYPRPQTHGGGYVAAADHHRPDSPISELYYNRELNSGLHQSPFSSSPQQHTASLYAPRGPQLKESLNNDLGNTLLHKLDTHDYDYLSRTMANVTTDGGDDDIDNDYNYDENLNDDVDDVDTNSTANPTKLYDKDGYLRPELMVDAMGKLDDRTNSTNTTNSINSTYLNDNYVLPALTKEANATKTQTATELPKMMVSTRSESNSKIKHFPDSEGKHLENDILADEGESHTMRSILPANVAMFAPINVLTKPDRPDNWVIYNKSSEEPPLPQPPTITMDSSPAAEVPTPIKDQGYSWKNTRLWQQVAPVDSSANDTAIEQLTANDTSTEMPN